MQSPNKLVMSSPRVMMGKPVIAGTRITVEAVLDKLAAGETVEQIRDAHPRLTREGIQAALAFGVLGTAEFWGQYIELYLLLVAPSRHTRIDAFPPWPVEG